MIATAAAGPSSMESPFIHFVPPWRGRIPGQDSSVQRMLDIFQAHAAMEEEMLKNYLLLAGAIADPLAVLLMRLVIEDEQRHHALLKRMVISLEDSLHWTHSPDAFPAGSAQKQVRPTEVIETTREFIRREREDARQFRKLAREEGQTYGGLFKVLLESIALDSQKHAGILRFILQRLQSVG